MFFVLLSQTSLSENSRSMNTMEAQLSALTSEVGSKKKENVELTQRVAELCSEIEAMKQRVMEGEDERRKLHNLVQELKVGGRRKEIINSLPGCSRLQFGLTCAASSTGCSICGKSRQLSS